MKRIKTGTLFAFLLASFLLYAGEAFAGIHMVAQLTDPEGAKGRINARITESYPNVDAYVGMITGSGSLYCLRRDQTAKSLFWESGVHPLLQSVSLEKSGWISLNPIDLSLAAEDPAEAVFLLVLTKAGADPLNRENWVLTTVVDFVTHPLQRHPGQSLFASADVAPLPILSPPGSYFNGAAGPPAEDDANRAQPEKADIFRISGQRLFYANSSGMRFQMIDLSDPASPALFASIPIRETPRELFLVGSYAFLIGSDYNAAGPSTVLRVFRTGDSIQEVQRLDLDQLTYFTSRRLGDRIYLVGTETPNAPCCDGGSQGMTAVYVLNITAPEQISVITRASSGNGVFDVYMDDRYLVLLGSEQWPSTGLEIFDLTAEPPLSRKAALSIHGLVPSEHHVHTFDSLLRVVYQQATVAEGSALAIYDLADLSNIRETGRVDGIAPGETLFATRFTGERAYVVTFERKDPLWVLDLSNSSNPRIVGQLEVPGWSEYMQFFEDRLLAIGYDDSQGKRLISVGLFSVVDPSNPVLLDRVTPLSEKASYSYSEATSDDRAFAFNRETGTVLFPIHYYDQGSGESVSGLEILKLKEAVDGFSWQSSVRSRFHVLRGSETNQASIVLSMGDSALNTIDVSTPPQASVLGELRLAYNVAQVAGRDSSDRIWTLGTDYYGYGESELILFRDDNLDTPERVEDTGLGATQFLINDQLGVLFEPQTLRLRAVDLQTVTLGGVASIEGVSPWSIQAPLLMGRTFYVADTTWAVLPWPDETLFLPGLDSGDGLWRSPFPMDAVFNPVQWRLLRYDCSDSQAPSPLPALSIPGRPIGFTANGKLVTLEEISPFYQASTLIPPEPTEPNGGLLVNVLTILADQAVLEASRFFPYAEVGYPTVLTDQTAIYVAFSKDQSTTVITLSPDDLSTVRSDDLEGVFVAVEAFGGKLLVQTTNGVVLPWIMAPPAADASFAPMPWYPPEVAVFDLTVTPPEQILSLEGEYINLWGAYMDDTGLYLAKGFAGLSFFPF